MREREKGGQKGNKLKRGTWVVTYGLCTTGYQAVPVLARLLLGTTAAKVRKLSGIHFVYCVLVVSEENILISVYCSFGFAVLCLIY